MSEFRVLFCKLFPILIVLGWTLPVTSVEQFNLGTAEVDSPQIFNIGESSQSQLFKPGLYWNPQRQGWGINLTQVSQDNGVKQLVAVIYTYRVDGTPIWYLASAPINGINWKAALQEFSWDGFVATPTNIGTIQLEFTTLNKAIMGYTINGESGSETIQFLEFDQGPTSTELTALWFPSAEPGRGLTVSTIGNSSVAVVYSYDDKGDPLWLIGSIPQAIGLGAETMLPVDLITGYCLACTTVDTTVTPAGALNLTFNSRSSAKLVTENISGWQADTTIVPLSDVLVASMDGDGECVNIPLVSSGSRIVVNIKSFSSVNDLVNTTTTKDITFTEVTKFKFTVDEIATTEITTSFGIGNTSRTHSLITVNQTIKDNMAFQHSSDSVTDNDTGTFVGKSEYTPALLKGPILSYCKGQTWIEPSVTQTITLNGDVTTSETAVAEGIVNSINEIISVPAGEFTTVFLTTTNSNTVHKEWRDINSGHIVKIEEFDDDGSTVRWAWEATLIQ